MGVEITLFALPENSPALQGVIDERLSGDILQTISHLRGHLIDGRPAADDFEYWADGSSNEFMDALKSEYGAIQQNPHWLALYFYGGDRGHDHWVYLLELVASDRQRELATTAVFGSQQVNPSSTATQGAPIMWSDPKQVAAISAFLQSVDIELIRSTFTGFPPDRKFYKRKRDDDLGSCLASIREVTKLYRRATRYELSVVSILD